MADLPEEHVGPLNPVEVLVIEGEYNRHNAEINRLDEVLRNLEASTVTTRRELQGLRDRQKNMIREVLRTRNKDITGKTPLRILTRPSDNTTWIVIGGPLQPC